MPPISLQKATIADVGKLQHIGRQTFFETFSAQNTEADMQAYLADGFSVEKLSAELQNPNSIFYFAVLDTAVIGYLKVNVGPAQTELKDANALEIERIYVLNEFQGQAVGQLLYEKAIDIARQRHADYVWLGVWEKNAKAMRFYQKNGFTAFDKHLFKLGSDEQTDMLMRLPLAYP